MYVIDASVQVSDLHRGDVHHEASRRLFKVIEAEGRLVICPEVLLPEAAATIARTTDDSDVARRLVRSLRRMPCYRFVPVDKRLADLAAELAAQHRIRGCDAIYVAVAYRLRIKLITWDKQQRERAAGVVEVLTPAEELEMLNSGGRDQTA